MGWSADTRARINLVLGVRPTPPPAASSGPKIPFVLPSHTFSGRLPIGTSETDLLEWAMVQQNLGSAQSDLSSLNLHAAPLQPAVAAYQNALAVYQSQSDRLDSAKVQFRLGFAFEKIGAHEQGVESPRLGRWIVIARR